MRLKSSFIFLAALPMLISCDDKRVFDEYKSISGGTWNKDSIVGFDVEMTDTVARYNLFVNVRNNNSYPYNNLYLIVEMMQPGTNLAKVDTLQYQMANPDGTLMGEGFTDIKENKLWYKENVTFPKPGKYRFNIQQAVRQSGKIGGVQELDGITDIGFRIETAK